MDELDALFFPGRDVFHEPAGKHGREHHVRFGIARFPSPDIEVLGFQGFYIVAGTAVEVVDVRRNGLSVFVDAGDAADDAVAHDGPDVTDVPAFFFHLPAAGRHALFDEAVIFIDVHLNPAGWG